MPYKLQTASYRTRNGQAFECVEDVLDTANGDLRTQAQAKTRALKAAGRLAFFEKMDGGAFYRVFAAAQG